MKWLNSRDTYKMAKFSLDQIRLKSIRFKKSVQLTKYHYHGGGRRFERFTARLIRSFSLPILSNEICQAVES
jgi:hypothetical protein